MKMLHRLGISALLTAVILTSGCATGMGKSLHEVSVLDPVHDLNGYQQKKVKVESKQAVVIATGNTDFADIAYTDLLAQCTNGRIVNVSANYSTDLGIFAYENFMRLEGICITKNARQ